MASESFINELVQEGFTVTDKKGRLVPGIPINQFTHILYDPTDASSTVSVTMEELTNGNYRASFTPNIIGTWYLVVYHQTYFPWGKSNDIVVKPNDPKEARQRLTNKQELQQIDEGTFIQRVYDDDETTVIDTVDITCDGDIETRDPR